MAGVRDFTFHDIRHTCVSHLVMAGIDLKTVQELLGHKTLTMTLRYSHLAPSHKIKAVSFFDKAMRGENLLYKNYTI
jgi:site-specific recombinase XerD